MKKASHTRSRFDTVHFAPVRREAEPGHHSLCPRAILIHDSLEAAGRHSVRTEISNRVTITISRITTVAEDKNPPLVPFRDSLLTNIVAFVNSQPRDEAGYPVTLLVNGATISGHIIPAANYCEEFGSKTGLGSFIAPLTEDMVGCRGEDLSDEIIEGSHRLLQQRHDELRTLARKPCRSRGILGRDPGARHD